MQISEFVSSDHWSGHLSRESVRPTWHEQRDIDKLQAGLTATNMICYFLKVIRVVHFWPGLFTGPQCFRSAALVGMLGSHHFVTKLEV
eukprot:1159022-Pelagomonas_calceolata.AAC.4